MAQGHTATLLLARLAEIAILAPSIQAQADVAAALQGEDCLSEACSTNFLQRAATAVRTERRVNRSLTEAEETYENPILRGSFPDPSIVRVGDDFFLASSSFEYFPGLPIHHSKDLVNWRLVGYALHRPEQIKHDKVNLIDPKQDDGVQAPTIRFHRGLFYVVATTTYNPRDGTPGRLVSFIVTATSAAGPWSMPHVLEGAVGIDPSLLFDDDGKVWYTANEGVADPEWPGQARIWLQELDIQAFKFIGKRYELTRGACGGVWVEGPHLFKYNGMYYLFTAEGGTGPHHAVMVAASKSVTGPYKNSPRNPVLTMRHVSYRSWVTRVGHADLVQLADGRWFAVALGVRSDVLVEEGPGGLPGTSTIVGKSNMGRESHLLPMTWESDALDGSPYMWPVISPETGRLERSYPLPLPGTRFKPENIFLDDFSGNTLGLEWNFRRLPARQVYSLTAHKGFLRLYARPEVIAPYASCSLVGIRQLETYFHFEVKMLFSTSVRGVEAGVMLFQKDDCYVKFVVVKTEEGNELEIVYAGKGNPPETLYKGPLMGYNGEISLHVTSDRAGYHYGYTLPGGREERVRTTSDDLLLYVGYTGNYLGLYATSNGNGAGAEEFADFDSVQHLASVKRG